MDFKNSGDNLSGVDTSINRSNLHKHSISSQPNMIKMHKASIFLSPNVRRKGSITKTHKTELPKTYSLKKHKNFYKDLKQNLGELESLLDTSFGLQSKNDDTKPSPIKQKPKVSFHIRKDTCKTYTNLIIPYDLSEESTVVQDKVHRSNTMATSMNNFLQSTKD